MATRKCRFCHRPVAVTKYTNHKCKPRKEAFDWYNLWRDNNKEDKIMLARFPTFESWDLAIMEGTVKYPDYPYSPIDYEGDTAGGEDVDTSGDSGADNAGDEDNQPGPGSIAGSEGPGDTNIADITGGYGAIIEGRPGDYVEKEDKKPAVSIGDIVDTVESFRLTVKNKAWLPVVSAVHFAIMWAFKAKDKNTYFRLDKSQKKILSQAYYATFGDCPLKLKVEGGGEYDQHIAFAYLEIYGEWVFDTGFDGPLDRGMSIMAWIKKKRGAADSGKTT